MATTPNSSLFELIARGPKGIEAQNALTSAQAQQAQSGAKVNQAQVPLVQQQTQTATLANQQTAQSIADQQILKQIWAQAASGSSGYSSPASGGTSPAQVGTPIVSPSDPNAPRPLIDRTGAQPPTAPAEASIANPQAAATGATLAQLANANAPPAPAAQAAPQQAAPQPANAPPPAVAAPVNYLSDPRALAMKAAQMGASGGFVQGLYQNGISNLTALSKLTSDQAANELQKLNLVKGATTGYLSKAEPTEADYRTYHDYVSQEEPNLAKTMPAPGAGVIPSQQDLAHVTGLTGATEQLLANQHVTAQTNEAQANAAKTGIEGDMARYKLNLLKNAANVNPQTIAQGVQGMSIFQGHPAEMQDAIDAGTAAYNAAVQDPDSAFKAAEKSQEAIKGIADRLRENSSGVVAGKASAAKATAAATAPVQESLQAANALREDALRRGDKATETYATTISDARQTVATAQTIHKIIDLASSGDPTAGAALKAAVPEFTNAIQDIKRMGGAQSAQITSALENAKGEIESGFGLSPVTQKALAGIRPYIDTVANGAVTRANSNIDATNTAYNTKFKPEPIPVQHMQNPNTGQIIVTRDGGKTWSDSTTGKPVQ